MRCRRSLNKWHVFLYAIGYIHHHESHEWRLCDSGHAINFRGIYRYASKYPCPFVFLKKHQAYTSAFIHYSENKVNIATKELLLDTIKEAIPFIIVGSG